jgi:hypothetical protein
MQHDRRWAYAQATSTRGVVGAISHHERERYSKPYHTAQPRCQFVNRPPIARSIQELVTVWSYGVVGEKDLVAFAEN